MMFSVIKAIKANMPDMNLVASKKFIESLPQVVRKDVPKELVFELHVEHIGFYWKCW